MLVIGIRDTFPAHHFEPLAPTQKRAVFKHVPAAWMEGPVRSLSGLVRSPRDFDKAVVEAQVVPKRILPALCVFSVVRKAIHDEFVNFAQCHHFVTAGLDRHRRQRNVGIGRFLVAVRLSRWPRHFSISISFRIYKHNISFFKLSVTVCVGITSLEYFLLKREPSDVGGARERPTFASLARATRWTPRLFALSHCQFDKKSEFGWLNQTLPANENFCQNQRMKKIPFRVFTERLDKW